MSVEHHLVVGTHEETVTRFMFPMLLGLSRDPTAGTEVGPLGDISADRKTLMLQQLTVAGSDSQIMWQCCTMSSPQTTHRGAPRNPQDFFSIDNPKTLINGMGRLSHPLRRLYHCPYPTSEDQKLEIVQRIILGSSRGSSRTTQRPSTHVLQTTRIIR